MQERVLYILEGNSNYHWIFDQQDILQFILWRLKY